MAYYRHNIDESDVPLADRILVAINDHQDFFDLSSGGGVEAKLGKITTLHYTATSHSANENLRRLRLRARNCRYPYL